MTNEIFIYLSIFSIGFLIAFLIFKKDNKNSLITTLDELKKTIEEYKLQNIISSKELTQTMFEATKLAKTLTTNQNLKGQYGENCLENIIKVCYPTENVDYIKQFNTENSENKKIKPDFLIKLPNEKSILIDCKVNLEKYIEYKNDNSKKNEFIKDLNTTINNLSNKNYESAKNINQPDFILMYIPLEPVITEIYTDCDYISVIKNANEKNIIIVGNSSILTTLRLTKLLWSQEKQAKNIQQIINIAENIYELIAKHSQNLYKIKEQLNESNEQFNKEFQKITSQNQLFKMTEELRTMGIQASNKKIGKKISEIEINKNFLN